MITEFDVDKISSLHPDICASYIPVGVDTEVFKPTCATKSIYGLIHATTYDWVHNVEALDWFIAEILPEIQKRFSTELVLLGKNMPKHYRNGKIPGLIGKGYVEDINLELNKASIYIAPLFVGGGIRIKILEAMSAGLPIIASPVSAEGIMAKREDGLIICSTKEEWILEISNLMENPLLTKQLGENARAFIEKNHSWECTANRMKLLIQELNA
jgi:glycosyltransferase involved in cell wall biosynthesis